MKRVLLFLVAALCFSQAINSQTFNIGTDLPGGVYVNNPMTDRGAFWQRRLQETVNSTAGTRKWEFNADGYFNTWRAPSGTPINIAGHDQVIAPNVATASAFFRASFGGGDGARLLATTNGNYYTFNISEPNPGAADDYINQHMAVLETNYNPKTISTVTSVWGNYGTRVVTVTLASAPSVGENVFVRYTTNNYASSTLVQCTFVGATGTATIPVQAQNATVNFYAYSSNRSAAAIGTDVTSFGQVSHDMSTLELGAGGTYAIPNNPVIVLSTTGTLGGTTTGYANMTAAFTAINGGTLHTGVITIGVINNTTEVASAVLNQVAGVTTIGIQPTGTFAVFGSIAGPIIDLSGADNVTIDGRIGGVGSTRSLTIVNDNTAGNTLRYINDAQSNTMRYCFFLATTNSTTDGVISFSTTSGANGNDNNTIEFCYIGNNAFFPRNGIYAAGTTTTVAHNNSGVVIQNNEIYNFFNATNPTNGILITSGNTDWTISGNSLYQDAPRNFTASNTHTGININNGSGNNFIISGNYLGGRQALAGGLAYTITGSGTFATRYRAISLIVGTTTASSVQGNIIANYAVTSSSGAFTVGGAWVGIYSDGGSINIGDITGNTIGSGSGTGSITVTTTNTNGRQHGIFIDSGTNLVISNNTIGSINAVGNSTSISNGVVGIHTESLTSLTMNLNTIGSLATANSLNAITASTNAGDQLVQGINNTSSGTINITNNTIANLNNAWVPSSAEFITVLSGINSTNGTNTITGNTVRDLNTAANATGTGTTASVIGIFMTSATAGQNVSANTIHSLANTHATASTAVSGLHIAGSTAGTSTVNRNFIHSLSLSTSSSGGEIRGINNNTSSVTTTYSNNMVRLGINAAGAALTTGYAISCFVESTGNNNLYHNTFYVGGTGVGTGAGSTFALRSSTTGNTRNYVNNILWNARSNATTGGKHYAIFYGGTTPNPTGLTASNNIILANGTGGVFGFYNSLDVLSLANWQTATGVDAASISANPQLIAPNGTSATVDLHLISAGTPAEQAGVLVAAITDDFDGVTARASLTPVDVGADAGNYVALDLSAPAITYTALTATCNTGNRTLSGVTITDATKVDTTATFRPRIYYRKGAGSYFSQQGTLTAGNPSSGTWSFTIVAADMGGLAAADVVSYYVIAQDSLVTPNVGSNPAIGLVATSVNAVSTHPTTPNSYTINNTLSGTYTVGAAGTYTTLDAAFTAYNTSCLGGPVLFSLIDNSYAHATVALTANADASATNTLTIKPTLANTVISGAILNGVIRLNGADYIIIDGSINTGTNSACAPVVSLSRDLTINNTINNTNVAVIWLSSTGVGAGATNNVIKNCNILSALDPTTSNNIYYGIISSGSSLTGVTEGADNNNNTFENNNITKVRFGIYVRGTGTTGLANDALFNTGNSVRQNTVGHTAFGTSQIGVAGIVMQGQNNATVSYNEVRFVGSLVAYSSAGTDRGGISFLDAKNSVMSHNNVHDIQDEKSFSAVGLSMGASNSYTTANTVSNNMVYNVRANGTFGDQALGMAVGPGVNDKVVYNTIVMSGDIDPAGTTTATGSACGVRIDPLVLATTNLEFRDNIITMDVTSNTGTLIHHALVRPTVGFVWGTGGTNYNDLYRNASNAQTAVGGTGTVVPYTAHTTLSDWQTATSQDANSVAIQPFFVSATNLHIDLANLANAALDNLGTPITGVTTDFDCATRSLTVPDMGADEFAIPACSGTPTAGTAVSSIPGPFCGSASATLSLTGTTAATGLAYQWQSSVTGVPGSFAPISGANANTFAVVSLGTTNYYQCEVTCTNSSLADTSSAVGLIINPAPTVAVTPTSYLICGTGSTPLTASGADAYAWSPAAGLSATTGASVTANPTVTTTYTITGTITATGCTGTTTVTIIVSPLVPTVTATASPLTVCEGGTVNLGTTVAGSTYTALSQNFNAANNWTTINNSTGGVSAAAAWTLRSNGYNYPPVFNSNDASQFYLSNSDAQGAGGTTATLLQSPAFSLAGLTAASLSYFHYYRDAGTSSDSAKVEVSTNGTNWTLVQSFQSTQGAPTGFVNASVNLNAYAGQATVFVRFNYKGADDWYWAIDNVAVTGPASYTYSWVSNVDGFTSTLQNPTNNPIGVTNYTVTVTNQFGCQNSDTQSVGYVLSPIVDAGVDQTSCSTNPYLFSGASESFTTGLLWTTAGTGTFTGTGTLTPTYTPVPLEVGTSIKFYLSGSGLSPCVAALDSVQLVISPLNIYYQDSDGDGFGNPFSSLAACTQPGGYVTDNTDCNDSNAALNPYTNWYADMDGDGFGSFIFLTSCTNPGVPGVVINGDDCNDSNPLIFPGSPEICQNFLDDDCDGIVDDGCSGVINDNWSDAIAVTGSLNAYPSCSVISGTCLNASISPEGTAAFVAAGGGRDVWYQFTAPSTGVQIKVQPTGFNALIELQTAAGVYIDHENVNPASGGLEILNRAGLTEGAVYRVGVRNFANSAGGAFTVCIAPLMDSRCASGSGTYAMCTNFKPKYTGANTYTFNFDPTGITPGANTSGSSASQISLTSAAPLSLQYNGTYDVLIDANYSGLVDGLGAADPITIVGTDLCSITIPAHPDVQVRLEQRCGFPTTLLKGSVLQGKPFVCGAVNFTVEFQQMTACSGGSTIGSTFFGTTPGASSSIQLSTVPGLLGGGKWYEVRWMPNFAYGSGSYGTVRTIFVGGAVMEEGNVADYGNMQEKDLEMIDAALYPNPNNGQALNLNLTNVDNGDVHVRITDAMGRMVYTNRFIVEGSLNTVVHFAQPLGSGLYLVELIADGKVTTLRMIVEQ